MLPRAAKCRNIFDENGDGLNTPKVAKRYVVFFHTNGSAVVALHSDDIQLRACIIDDACAIAISNPPQGGPNLEFLFLF